MYTRVKFNVDTQNSHVWKIHSPNHHVRYLSWSLGVQFLWRCWVLQPADFSYPNGGGTFRFGKYFFGYGKLSKSIAEVGCLVFCRFHMTKPGTVWWKLIAQLPKSGLVGGHDKPMPGSFAICFPRWCMTLATFPPWIWWNRNCFHPLWNFRQSFWPVRSVGALDLNMWEKKMCLFKSPRPPMGTPFVTVCYPFQHNFRSLHKHGSFFLLLQFLGLLGTKKNAFKKI